MKICIVGSYKWTPQDAAAAQTLIRQIFQRMLPYKDTIQIISGECPKGGTDIWARDEALRLGFQYIGHAPTENNKAYYMKRNKEMATSCDALIRVHSKISTTFGSGITLVWAKQAGKPVLEFKVGTIALEDAIGIVDVWLQNLMGLGL